VRPGLHLTSNPGEGSPLRDAAAGLRRYTTDFLAELRRASV